MGAEQSTLALDSSRGPQYAFRVLRVDADSPAAAARLVPYFDYITSVNGVDVVQDVPNVVSEMAKNHIDRPMKMAVYSARTDETRKVTIIPSRAWPGKTLLGSSIRFALLNDAVDRVWHVLDTSYESPAHRAGLVPYKDWIIGSPEIEIGTQDDFYNLMIHNQKKAVRLLVFNIDTDAVREVSVTPDFGWGGEGCLGCDVASGALHRIPRAPASVSTAPPPAQSPTTAAPDSGVAHGSSAQARHEAPPHQEACIAPLPQIAANALATTREDAAALAPIPGFGPISDDGETPSFLQ